MIKIYTPKDWLSIFGGSPSLVIDDNGYIYTEEGYFKIFSDSPIGKVDFVNGYIYDKHYADIVTPNPIAYMVDSGDVIKVYKYGESQSSNPLLYIKNDEIYTYEEFSKLFGSKANGYIKKDNYNKYDSNVNTSKNTTSQNSGQSKAFGLGDGLLMRISLIVGYLIVYGLVYLLSDEARVASMTVVFAVIANVGAIIYFLIQLALGKLHFHFDSKAFAKALLKGVGVYVLTTAVFVLLGLISNLGTGNALSDAGGDKMELAAMFIGVPFVLRGLFAEGRAPYTKTTTKKTYATNTSKDFDKIFSLGGKSSHLKTYAKTKEVFCPHCNNRCITPVKRFTSYVVCPYCKKGFAVKSK